ncbi:recombinase family protein [Nonomuraea sp. JJY05]|uniref:recombinase family protein n=1 Tax=Nonomuraea sp. JJY05 TaxID=3350255 RepID=UPI00373E223E
MGTPASRYRAPGQGAPDKCSYIDRGFSGTTHHNRAGLDHALAAVWNGWVFTVTRFDRYARKMTEVKEIFTHLSDRESC